MIRGVYQENAGARKEGLERKRAWLCASLMLVLITACTPTTASLNLSTQVGPESTATQPTSTAVIARGTAQHHTATPSFTATNTSQPSTSSPTLTFTPKPTNTTSPAVVFAAIGDYGSGNQDEADIAKLIESWQPNFIITLGDNNYPIGAADHMDEAIGQFFHNYIFPYPGSSGEGATENRFFPCLGNHDVISKSGKPYLDYFTLPGNERYYDYIWGPVHLFALDDIESEPDGVGASSIQAQWLKTGLADSTTAWNIVYMHYAPYSSGMHGSTDWARWPYGEWGADAVLAGHDHTYERLEENGLPYFVNGLGGAGRYDFISILAGSQVRYNSNYGAMRVEATETQINFEFITRTGEVVDSFEMRK